MKKFLLMFLLFFAGMANAQQTVTLTSQNFVALKEEVTDESVSKVIEKLFTHKGDAIYLYISSPGGSIIAGNALINAMESSGKRIICIADFAASMAFSILQACDERLYVGSAIIMQHQASYQAKGSSSQIKKTVEFVEKLVLVLNKRDAKRLGLSLDKFKELVHDEWWMVDDEMKANNAADAKVNLRCSAELTAKREVTTIRSLFGSVELEWSGCPLVYYPISVKMNKEKGTDNNTFFAWYYSLKLDRDWKTTREVR